MLWANEPGLPSTKPLRAARSLLSKAEVEELITTVNDEGRRVWPGSVLDLDPKIKKRLYKNMQKGSPKLRYLHFVLKQLRNDPKKKLLLWCNHLVSQWTVTLVSVPPHKGPSSVPERLR